MATLGLINSISALSLLAIRAFSVCQPVASLSTMPPLFTKQKSLLRAVKNSSPSDDLKTDSSYTSGASLSVDGSPLKRKSDFVVVTPPSSDNVPAVAKSASSRPRKRRPMSVTPDITVPRTPEAHEDFHDLGVHPSELRPSATLTTGQCFHWKALNQNASHSAWGTYNATDWIGNVRYEGHSVVLLLRETPETTLYRVLYALRDIDIRQCLHSYFQLSVPLGHLYDEWSSQCPRLSRIASLIPGVRIVDQDPFECLISFICSSNNNIPRITKMLEAIRQEYGKPLITFEGSKLYSFPSLEALKTRATEQDLRSKCGLGYRAKYIVETVKKLDSLGGEKYLHELRSIDAPTLVQEKLLQFCGVGRKVADCVALFSLKQPDAIPVDVHVWNIARRDYDDNQSLMGVKSLTPTIYRQVGDLFRSRFPNRSGWAHSLLFVAELPSFRPVLPHDLVQEMDKFRQEEKAKKARDKDDRKPAL